MNISRSALIRAAIGIGISLVAIFILVRSVDIGAALQVIATASPAWIAVMLVTTTIDIGARGARWRALLAPIAPLRYRRVLGYTYIGYLANNVLPARLGELYRSHALGEGEGVSRPTVLGTVVVERVVDTVMVVAIASLAVLVLSVRGVMQSAVLLGLAFVALLIIALGLGMAAHRLPGADRVTAIIAKRPRLLELARRLQEGLQVAGKPRPVAIALGFSAVAWAASTMTFLAAGQSIGLHLTIAQGALLTSGVALATIVPSGPGFVGTFELTVVAIADSLGIPRESAFALGLLVHVMILATTTIGGVIGLVALRRRGPANEANTGEGANVAPTSSAPSERLGKPGGEPTR
jgi:glycosyltransferase 2 family protein